MTPARIRLIVAAVVFAGWLTWLALAVAQKDRPHHLSRAQLIEARMIVVAEVTAGEDGLPLAKVKIVQRLTEAGPEAGAEVEVRNLPAAAPPGKAFPGSGQYLLPLSVEPSGYRISGLPRSPGFEGTPFPERPSIYPWNAETKTQIQSLGYKP